MTQSLHFVIKWLDMVALYSHHAFQNCNKLSVANDDEGLFNF